MEDCIRASIVENQANLDMLNMISSTRLSSLAITEDDKWLFSAANDVTNDEHARLNEDNAEAIQC